MSAHYRTLSEILAGKRIEDGFDVLVEFVDVRVEYALKRGFASDLEPCWIYVIEAPALNTFKIGKTISPRSRLASIQTGCPARVRLAAAFRGARMHETILHETFESWHQHGEWFGPSEYMHDLIRLVGVEA